MIKRLLATFGLILLASTAFAGPVVYSGRQPASQPSVVLPTDFFGAGLKIIDSFEDENLDEYSFNSGSSSDVSFSSNSKNGDFSLAIDNTSTNTISISSTSGLDNYPSLGDTFKLWFFPDSTNAGDGRNMIFAFGFQNLSNHYRVVMDADDSAMNLFVISNGSVTDSTSNNSVGFTEDEWNQLKVEWGNDNTIKVTGLDKNGNKLGNVSLTDSTYTNGGIELRLTSQGESNKYDFIRMNNNG